MSTLVSILDDPCMTSGSSRLTNSAAIVAVEVHKGIESYVDASTFLYHDVISYVDRCHTISFVRPYS